MPETKKYTFNKELSVNENIDNLCEYYDLYDAIKKNIKIIAKQSYVKGFKTKNIK